MSVLKVSVREARQHFRRQLDQVQAGDEVVVSCRGVEVARLVRQARSPARLPDLDSFHASMEVGGRPAEPGDRRQPAVEAQKPVMGAYPLDPGEERFGV